MVGNKIFTFFGLNEWVWSGPSLFKIGFLIALPKLPAATLSSCWRRGAIILFHTDDSASSSGLIVMSLFPCSEMLKDNQSHYCTDKIRTKSVSVTEWTPKSSAMVKMSGEHGSQVRRLKIKQQEVWCRNERSPSTVTLPLISVSVQHVPFSASHLHTLFLVWCRKLLFPKTTGLSAIGCLSLMVENVALNNNTPIRCCVWHSNEGVRLLREKWAHMVWEICGLKSYYNENHLGWFQFECTK